MRKLASIQRIWKIEPIEGADRIELAYVLGWTCVVNKGQFKPMELAVYFEIDSFLPIRQEFEFMRASSYKKNEILGEGFRLRTMRFRGQISQGLLMPISTFSEIPENAALGEDVSAIIGVRKWELVEEKATSGGTVIGNLPYDIPKTDETRVQAEPDLIKEFAGLEYYISTKMDGSSHSVSVDEDGFHVTGHNYEYKDDGKSSFYELVKKMNLEEKMRTFVRENGKRVGLNRMLEVCKALELQSVPIEEVGTDLPSKYPTVEALLERSDGEYPNGGKKEGIVIRPTEPIYCPLISASLSMKVVNNKYLLKNED